MKATIDSVGRIVVENGASLATRDGRARSTYETIGVQVVVAV